MVSLDERAVAGTFEELSSLLMVGVATLLFLVSLAKGFVSYSRYQEENDRIGELESLCESVLSYEPLLYHSRKGQLDHSKLNEASREMLEEHLGKTWNSFHFNLTLIDVSPYEEKYIWFAGEELPGSSLARTALLPATVSNQYGEHHSVLLRITVWW